VRILVVGAGAVGSLFAARLSAAGYGVELTARPDHVAAIRAHGLRVEGTSAGTFRPTALRDLAEASPPNVVLLTVKTFDLGRAATALSGQLPELVPILLPQNGLHVEASVAAALRPAGRDDAAPWLVRAVNSIPVTLVGPGVVRQAGVGEILIADPSAAGPSASAARDFVPLFERAGLALRLVHDLDRELWRKALVNAAINPVTALHRVPNGRLRDSPYREEATGLLREAQRAAAAEGFHFSDAEADADLERVVRATAENRSSMLQDRDRGRPTEIDAISGELLRAAAAHGFELPRTRAVVARLGTTPPPTEPS
jgi:2-dehydropantoate 2-reductase